MNNIIKSKYNNINLITYKIYIYMNIDIKY
jgi:hypothetical protein